MENAVNDILYNSDSELFKWLESHRTKKKILLDLLKDYELPEEIELAIEEKLLKDI